MIPPPKTSRVTVVAVALALIASGTAGLLTVRLSDQRDRADRLQAQLEFVQQELGDLRKRLTSDASGGVLGAILHAVSKLRGLAIEHDVAAEVLTTAELKERVISSFEHDSPRAEIDRTAKVLGALGLLKANDDLFKILEEVQGEQVGGFYDPRAKKMVVGGDAKDPSPLDKVLLAHEYTHALTDQHFGIDRTTKLNDEGKDDEAEAFLSLIEGDATLLMGEYAREALTPTEQTRFGEEASGVKTTKLDAAPPFLKTTLLFPYDDGLRFAKALFDAGGNAAIDRAYKDPPTSTEQIIHPSKYLGTRDDPTPVTVPDLSHALGTGWSRLDDGAVGELDVRIILDQFVSTTDANDAAAGWDGGRYRAYASSNGVVFAGLTAWDSSSEAEEATSTFDDWLPARYGRQGSERRIPGFTGKTWEGSSGAGEVVRDGQKMLLLLCPALDQCEKARGAFGSFGSTAV